MKRSLALLALVSTIAHAETYDYTGKFGLGLGLGRNFPLFDTGIADSDKSGAIYNLHGRYNVSAANGFVFAITRDDFSKTAASATTYDLMFQQRTLELERLSPIWGVGAGLTDFSKSKGNSDLKVQIKGRAGLEYSICQAMIASLTVDLRYIPEVDKQKLNSTNSSLFSIVPQVNLTYFFDMVEQVQAAPVRREAPAPVAAVAPKDSDNDGVIDPKDKCPNTPAGKTVNAYGCVPQEKAHIRVEVMFASSSAVVPFASHENLRELADFLKEHSKTKAEIQGHSDSSGIEKKNKVLSHQRADAVKAYLIKKFDIPASRLSSHGYGSDKPVASNKTYEGRTENRRVMAVVEE
jgi:OmpA-OmpF porin, OOP family